MRDLGLFNRAFLAKQGWRLIQFPNYLVGKTLKENYFRDSSFLDAKARSKPSFFWKSMLWGRKVIEAGSRWWVGSSDSIRMVDDSWIPTPHTFRIPNPPRIPENFRVSDFRFPCGAWNKEFIVQLFGEEVANDILYLLVG